MTAMDAFPDGLAVAARFDDFDALARATDGWDLTYSQTGGGSFTGAISMASTAQMQIVHQTWSAPLLVEGQHPPGTVSLAMVMSASGPVRWLGREIGRRVIFGGATRDHEVDFHSHGEMEILAVSLSPALFDAHLLARFGMEGGALGRNPHLRLLPAAADAGQRGHALNLLRGVLASGAANGPEARRHLQEAALQILFDGIDAGEETGFVSLGERRRAAGIAEEILRSRLDGPPSLAELCRLSGIGERRLHLAFQEAFGLSPKRYLRVLRLNAARRRLRRCEGSVTEVAASLGFFHFARFAAEYGQLFGQLPSETLRQARRERGLHGN